MTGMSGNRKSKTRWSISRKIRKNKKMATTKQYQKRLKQNEKLKKQNQELKKDLEDMADSLKYYRKCYDRMCNESYKHRDQAVYLTGKLKQIRALTFNL